jgi:diguanylate cyclase (GGDEF)-like protein/PAS domain S-box-containing protein
MPNTKEIDQTSNIRLLDNFYRIFLILGITFLTIGVPFVFYRKAASALVCTILVAAVAHAWRVNRQGFPQKSLKQFATVFGLMVVGLLFAGLPPVTAASTTAVAVMLSVVVNLRAGIIFAGSCMLAWLIYIVLGFFEMAPPAYLVNKPLVSWFIGVFSVWLVLLPIPALVRNLRSALSLQRATLESTTDGIVVIDNAGKISVHNQRFVEMWGIPADALAAGDDTALRAIMGAQAKAPQSFEAIIGEMQANPERSSQDNIQLKDGRLFERHSLPQWLDEKVVGRVWSFRDVTERLQGQQRMELALAGADLGLWDLDIASGTFTHNPRLANMLGYRFGELGTDEQTFTSLLHPDDAPHLHAAFYAHLKGETPGFESEHRLRHKDEHWVWVLARGKVVERDENGRAVRMIGTDLDISERKRSEALLRAREARLANLISSMQDLVIVLDTGGKVTEYFQPPHARRPSRTPETIIGKTYTQILPADVAALFDEAIGGIIMDGRPRTIEYPLSIAGEEIVSSATINALTDNAEYPTGFLAVVRDITEERAAQQAISRLSRRNALLLDCVGEGIYGVDLLANATFVNKAATDMLGFAEDEVLGKNQHTLFHHHHQDGTPYPDELCPIAKTLSDGQARHSEAEWFWRKDGSGFPVSLMVTPIIEGGERVGAVVAFQDITIRKKAEAEIHSLAFYDSLTKLPNRRLLLDRLHHAQASSNRSQHHGALLFLDLDNFKTLNDSLGHDAGDLLLQQVGQRIATCVREADTVARLGGDEFVAMLEELSDQPEIASAQAEAVGKKILAAFNQPYQLDGHEYRSTPSIGITLFLAHRQSAATLLKQADLAMYQAKAAGRNTLHLFKPDNTAA